MDSDVFYCDQSSNASEPNLEERIAVLESILAARSCQSRQSQRDPVFENMRNPLKTSYSECSCETDPSESRVVPKVFSFTDECPERDVPQCPRSQSTPPLSSFLGKLMDNAKNMLTRKSVKNEDDCQCGNDDEKKKIEMQFNNLTYKDSSGKKIDSPNPMCSCSMCQAYAEPNLFSQNILDDSNPPTFTQEDCSSESEHCDDENCKTKSSSLREKLLAICGQIKGGDSTQCPPECSNDRNKDVSTGSRRERKSIGIDCSLKSSINKSSENSSKKKCNDKGTSSVNFGVKCRENSSQKSIDCGPSVSVGTVNENVCKEIQVITSTSAGICTDPSTVSVNGKKSSSCECKKPKAISFSGESCNEPVESKCKKCRSKNDTTVNDTTDYPGQSDDESIKNTCGKKKIFKENVYSFKTEKPEKSGRCSVKTCSSKKILKKPETLNQCTDKKIFQELPGGGTKLENNKCSTPSCPSKDEKKKGYSFLRPNIMSSTTTQSENPKTDDCDLNQVQNNQLILKNQLATLQEKNANYCDESNQFQQLVESCSCPGVKGQSSIEKLSKDLKMENMLLRNELEDLRLELKQAMETVQGPLQHKLLKEQCRYLKLEEEFEKTKECMKDKQKMKEKEICELKMELCNCSSNVDDLNEVNRQLQEELSSLNAMCEQLEDDLLKQKILEAETIQLMAKKQQKQAEAVACNCITSDDFICEENLHVIARKLSETIKLTEPCAECANIPPEITGACKYIKDLTDLVDQQVLQKEKKKKSGRSKCKCEKSKRKNRKAKSKDQECQCTGVEDNGTQIGAQGDILKADDNCTCADVVKKWEVAKREGKPFKHETNCPCGEEKEIKLSSCDDSSCANKRTKPMEISGNACLCKPSKKGDRRSVSQDVGVDPTPESQDVALDPTKEVQDTGVNPVMKQTEDKQEGCGDSTCDQLGFGGRKTILNPTDTEGDLNTEITSSRKDGPTTDIDRKNILNPTDTEGDSNTGITSSRKDGPTTDIDSTFPSGSATDNQFDSKPTFSNEPPSSAPTCLITCPAFKNISKTGTSSSPGVCINTCPAHKNDLEKSSGPFDKNRSPDGVKGPGDSKNQNLGIFDTPADFPFEVITDLLPLSGDTHPADLNVTTTITDSGTLEVITEGPNGIIETTLVYTPDGNIEVITEIVDRSDLEASMGTGKLQYSPSGRLLNAEGTPFNDTCPCQDEKDKIKEKLPTDKPAKQEPKRKSLDIGVGDNKQKIQKEPQRLSVDASVGDSKTKAPKRKGICDCEEDVLPEPKVEPVSKEPSIIKVKSAEFLPEEVPEKVIEEVSQEVPEGVTEEIPEVVDEVPEVVKVQEEKPPAEEPELEPVVKEPSEHEPIITKAASITKEPSETQKIEIEQVVHDVVAKEPSVIREPEIKKEPSADKKVSVTKEEPVVVQKESSVIKKEPSVIKKEPSVVKKVSSVIRKEPSVVKKEPSVLKRESSVIKKEPSFVKKEPSVIKKEPSIVIKKESSVIKKEPSVVKKEPSVIKKESSIVIKKASSVIKKEPSIIKKEPSVIRKEPSVVKKESSIAKMAESEIKPVEIKKKSSDTIKLEPSEATVMEPYTKPVEIKKKSSEIIKKEPSLKVVKEPEEIKEETSVIKEDEPVVKPEPEKIKKEPSIVIKKEPSVELVEVKPEVIEEPRVVKEESVIVKEEPVVVKEEPVIIKEEPKESKDQFEDALEDVKVHVEVEALPDTHIMSTQTLVDEPIKKEERIEEEVKEEIQEKVENLVKEEVEEPKLEPIEEVKEEITEEPTLEEDTSAVEDTSPLVTEDLKPIEEVKEDDEDHDEGAAAAALSVEPEEETFDYGFDEAEMGDETDVMEDMGITFDLTTEEEGYMEDSELYEGESTIPSLTVTTEPKVCAAVQAEAEKSQVRDSVCQSTAKFDQSLQCRECRTIGVTTPRITNTATEMRMEQQKPQLQKLTAQDLAECGAYKSQSDTKTKGKICYSSTSATDNELDQSELKGILNEIADELMACSEGSTRDISGASTQTSKTCGSRAIPKFTMNINDSICKPKLKSMIPVPIRSEVSCTAEFKEYRNSSCDPCEPNKEPRNYTTSATDPCQPQVCSSKEVSKKVCAKKHRKKSIDSCTQDDYSDKACASSNLTADQKTDVDDFETYPKSRSRSTGTKKKKRSKKVKETQSQTPCKKSEIVVDRRRTISEPKTDKSCTCIGVCDCKPEEERCFGKDCQCSSCRKVRKSKALTRLAKLPPQEECKDPHPPECDCMQCICAPCNDPVILKKVMEESASKCSARVIRRTRSKQSYSEIHSKKKPHEEDCTCLDCLCMPVIERLAQTKEPPLPGKNQVYHVLTVRCACSKGASKIPIALNSTRPPKPPIRPCDCDVCKCDPCADQKKEARSCDCKPKCECDECKNKKKVEEPVNKDKICSCGECGCKPTCPILALKSKAAEEEKKHPKSCTCIECLCEECVNMILPEPQGPLKLNDKGHPVDCDCELCKCEKAIPVVHPPDCDCTECTCELLKDFQQAAAGPHPKDCDCTMCTCVGLLDFQKKQAKSCDCPECKCEPCVYKVGVGKAIGCTCSICSCDGCTDLTKRKENACTCKVCMCTPDDTCMMRRAALEAAEEAARLKANGCTCDACECNDDAKCKNPQQEVEIIPCDCTPECKCEDCADPAVGHVPCDCTPACECTDCADPNKTKAEENCDCEICKCDEKGQNVEVTNSPSDKTTEMKKDPCADKTTEMKQDECDDKKNKKLEGECNCDSCKCEEEERKEKAQKVASGECDCEVCKCDDNNGQAPCGTPNCTCPVCQCLKTITETKKDVNEPLPVCTCTICDCLPGGDQLSKVDKQTHGMDCTCDVCCCEPNEGKKKKSTSKCGIPECHCAECKCPTENPKEKKITKGKDKKESPCGTPDCNCAKCECTGASGDQKGKCANATCQCLDCKCTYVKESTVTVQSNTNADKDASKATIDMSKTSPSKLFPCTCAQCKCEENKQKKDDKGSAGLCPNCNCCPCECNLNLNKAGTKDAIVEIKATTEDVKVGPGSCPNCNCSPCKCETGKKEEIVTKANGPCPNCQCSPCKCLGDKKDEKSTETGPCPNCKCCPCKCETKEKQKTEEKFKTKDAGVATTPTDNICKEKEKGLASETKKIDEGKGSCPNCQCCPCKCKGGGDPPPFEVPVRKKCECSNCECIICQDKSNKKGGDKCKDDGEAPLFEVPVREECKCSPCQCAQCNKGPSKEEKKIDCKDDKKSTRSKDKCKDDISKYDSKTLKKKIASDKEESCKCKQEIEEIRKTLDNIRCSCTEAELKAMQKQPFVKTASSFGDTMSGLKMALANLEEKCKAKDKMIDAMTGELKSRAGDKYVDKLLKKKVDCGKNIPDYDKAKKTVDKNSTDCGEPRKSKTKKKKSKSEDFEIVDIRRITNDSIIVKWSPPCMSKILGFDIFVNGVLKSKVMSGDRTSAMIHSLDLSSTIQITIYAVSKCGRNDPPAIAIYEICTK